MPNPIFLRADLAGACNTRRSLLGIQAEYLHWVHFEMAQCFPALSHGAGLSQLSEDISSMEVLEAESLPDGMYYLIEADGKAAGMCGLRDLGGGTAEVKRLYIRPAYRGLHLGSLALRRLYADASQAGHTCICLDTALFMQAAHRLYEAHGFVDCAAYEGTEVPVALQSQWRFMQRAIHSTSTSTSTNP